jgi:hypothetical protein
MAMGASPLRGRRPTTFGRGPFWARIGAQGLLALAKSLSRNSKNAKVGMRLGFPFARALRTLFDLPLSARSAAVARGAS